MSTINNLTKTRQKRKVALSCVASMDTLKDAHRLLAKVAHPDLNGGNGDTMAEINLAWENANKLAQSQMHIGIVLDDSGSMKYKSSQAIRAFNSFVSNQSTKGQTTIGLSTFHQVNPIVPIKEVAKLTRDSYSPRGNTPLYDTIAYTILGIDRDLSNPSDGIVVVIITDGEECASREYNAAKLRELIEAKLALGWSFLYISCAWGALSHAQRIGIPRECVSSFQDLQGKLAIVSDMITRFRLGEIKKLEFKPGEKK